MTAKKAAAKTSTKSAAKKTSAKAAAQKNATARRRSKQEAQHDEPSALQQALDAKTAAAHNASVSDVQLDGFADGMVKKIVSVDEHDGYEIRELLIDATQVGGSGIDYPIKAGFVNGQYIGDPEMTEALVEEFGITEFEKRTSSSSVPTIGKSAKNGKWYGWSHRGIAGFQAGDVVAEGDVLARDAGGPFPVGKKCKDVAEARVWAIAFAEAVG